MLRCFMPCFAFASYLLLFPALLLSQGETTSAIVGQVTDMTHAAIPGARITITNRETSLQRTVTTDDQGRFNFPQLKPGSYSVNVTADGFAPAQDDNVISGLGQTKTVNFTLKISSSKSSVEVSGEALLINPGNANTSTNLNAPALENLPNPGGDLTYPLQFAPGALINTAGSSNDFVGSSNGYGNVEFNGLPALSNGYIVDGLETNDPLTNLNSGLSTNLVLGLNSIAEVTVNTLSYAVDQGRYGASQINYVTKSGSNQFHGNLYELWNGSRFNAADFFTNSTPGNHKPRSNVNHFGGSLGGPVLHDKLFFFFDLEWIRIALPIVTATTVPTPAFETYVLQQLPLGGTDSVTGSVYAPSPQSVPFYRQLFSLYQNTSGTPLAVLGCPFDAGGVPPATPNDGNGCANRQSISHSSDDHEQVQTVRLDYNLNQLNTLWFRFQADTGVQAAWTDPINPLFDAVSPQPLYSFAAGYTHIFSQNVVNYFNPAFSWYESLFGPANLAQTLAAFPMVLQGQGANAPFTTLGGLDNTWIQGRRASRFFVNDNLAWSHGAHEFRFGTNTRIFRLNDYDFGEGSVPTVAYATLPQFIYGVASTATQTFPTSANEPFNFLNLDLYAQDTWKLTPKLTWTIGLHLQLQPAQSPRPNRPPHRFLRFHLPRRESAFELRHPHRPRQRFLFHTPRYPPAPHRSRLAISEGFSAPRRLRPLQRHSPRHHRRRGRRQSSLRADLSRRPSRHCWRHGHRPRRPRKCYRRRPRRPPALRLRLSAGRPFLRFASLQSSYLPSSHQHHRGS
jgi:Carboxypeptidase regulatory-like domain